MKSKALIASFSAMAASSGAIPFPFADVAIMVGLISTAIIKIGSFYGYAWRKISKNDIISIMNGEKYVKKIEDDDSYTDTNKTQITPTKLVIFDIIKGLLVGSFITASSLVIDDGLKLIPAIGTVLGCIVGSAVDFSMMIIYGKRANNYFYSKCEADDGTLFFCVRCNEYEIIFKKMKEFKEEYLIYPQ